MKRRVGAADLPFPSRRDNPLRSVTYSRCGFALSPPNTAASCLSGVAAAVAAGWPAFQTSSLHLEHPGHCAFTHPPPPHPPPPPIHHRHACAGASALSCRTCHLSFPAANCACCLLAHIESFSLLAACAGCRHRPLLAVRHHGQRTYSSPTPICPWNEHPFCAPAPF